MIASTGEMYVVDVTGPAGSAAQFISLDGISFPAAESNLPINSLTPQNGWNAGSTGPPAYYVTGGVVHLTGSVKTTGLPNHSPLATLPAGAQPTSCTIGNVLSNGVVYLNGGVFQSGPGTNVAAVLPLTARPVNNLFFTLTADNGKSCYLNITTDGSMHIANNNPNQGCFLGGLSYQESS